MPGRELKYLEEDTQYVVHISSYPPRECGLATFTRDLTDALDKKYNPITKARIFAMNDGPTALYNYGKKVIGQIAAGDEFDYAAAATRINKNKAIKLVNIQHEFGIFGGDWGSHINVLLQALEKPVVITLHSVLPNPNERLRKVMNSIAAKSKILIVMNDLSKNCLVKDYGIAKSKISVILHGIPQTTFETTERAKEELGFQGKLVLSTFGLLSAGKGIEYALMSLPQVVKKFPNILYLVLGETHPQVRKASGEEYRNFLQKEVERLKLKNHVRFYNKYLTLDEIVEFLKATDVYISPSLGKEQSVSGTLSYAMGVGRPVISTPTNYARYMVNGMNGILVDFKNARAITRSLLLLLASDSLRKDMSQEAYECTRKMTWPNVAQSYFRLYRKYAALEDEKKLPEIKFDHMVRLTDSVGMIQHSKFSKPDKRYGYAVDDNARALIVALKAYELDLWPDAMKFANVYLKFLKSSENGDGTFAKALDSKMRKHGPAHEEVQGRVIWSLGFLLSKDFIPADMRSLGAGIFRKILVQAHKFEAPRAIALAISGLYFYLKSHKDVKLMNLFKTLSEKQYGFYEQKASHDWQWFEDVLTYSNSKLPESLLYAYKITGENKYLRTAESTLNFLSSVTYEGSRYVPIGQNGWYYKGKKRAYYDQQPEDPASMAEAKLLAWKITKNPEYLRDASIAFHWFLGRNQLRQMVYDEGTGGCLDGLDQNSMNLNQGAESTVAYLMARLAFEDPEVKNLVSNKNERR